MIHFAREWPRVLNTRVKPGTDEGPADVGKEDVVGQLVCADGSM